MSDLFARSPLEQSFRDLERDLISDDGPRISAVRNYPFAILVYRPNEEFILRQHVQTTTRKLERAGWAVLTLSLQALLFARLRREDPKLIDQLIELERATTRVNGVSEPSRGLNVLQAELPAFIEGPDGLAADIAAHVSAFRKDHPDKADRTVVLIGRAGALFPFFRSSALLKHLDGRTGGVPTILLYPGQRRGDAGLSFMNSVPPDRDYRPRIYG